MFRWIDLGAWALFFCLAILFAGLASYSALQQFDAIPFWDMFDGYLNFYSDFSNGDWSALWNQHNEHRIVLSKLLFVFDLAVLNGTTPFLIWINLALVGLIAIQFIAFMRSISGGKEINWIPWFIITVMFSRIQGENLDSAFQSQFFLVNLLPLSALFYAAKSVNGQCRTKIYFVASILCAVAAVGAMANGILALPVLFVFALLTRMSFSRIILLALLSAACLGLYLHGYTNPAGHSSLLDGLNHYPQEMLAYTLLYLGGVFETTAPIESLKFSIGVSMGALLIMLIARKTWSVLQKGREAAFEIALIGFAGFVIATAIVTAGGRVEFGISQATAERYHTPSLMCWLAVVLLYLPEFVKAGPLRRYSAIVIALTCVALMLPRQLMGLKDVSERSNRMIAALALELQIPDQEWIVSIYPDANRAILTSKQARSVPMSIFALPPVAGARDLLINGYIDAPVTECDALINAQLAIPNSSFRRVTGQVTLPGSAGDWTRLTFSDPDGKVKGVGISKFNELGFTGYLQNNVGSDLYIGTESARCKLKEVQKE